MDITKTTLKITVNGIVQGVGFRPFILRNAVKHKIFGTVKNLGGVVEIIAQGEKSNLDDFLKGVNNHKAEISAAEIFDIKYEEYNIQNVYYSFEIIKSINENTLKIIPADAALCECCAAEIADKANRRARHFFCTCTQCGPRYSVINELPYERAATTMDDFVMCSDCAEEFNNADNRRCCAETISCKSCGPKLFYKFKNSQKIISGEAAFIQSVKDINCGEVILIKGIGGYHLAASAFKEIALEKIRRVKRRDDKPFAVMFPNMQEIMRFCEVSERESEALQSAAAPIVLLKLKPEGLNRLPDSILKGNLRCGCMLPYTPLHKILLKETGALVLTSANFSSSPIIYDDDESEQFLLQNVENIGGMLYTDRKIENFCDDSVIQIVDNKLQFIRRSRGFAPLPVAKIEDVSFAAGGDLKASFCICKDGFAYPSVYFGDLENPELYSTYKMNIEKFARMLNLKLQNVKSFACDMHPNYFSGEIAKSLVKEHEISSSITFVQHHHAHIASVMAEYKLQDAVIGVAFDGTGYGTDGAIWGGEFLLCKDSDFERVAHLEYTSLLGGDNASQNAAQTAICMCESYEIPFSYNDLFSSEQQKTDFSSEQISLMEDLIKNGVGMNSSSMGRLFDSISAILGICRENTYEAQCAIMLQQAAEIAAERSIKPTKMRFKIDSEKKCMTISSKDILITCLKAKKNSDEIAAAALGFHYAAAEMVRKVCLIAKTRYKTNNVALSGGVFQNSFLLKMCMDILKNEGFDVYINEKVPPNDGGIALGQAYIMEAKNVHSDTDENNKN